MRNLLGILIVLLSMLVVGANAQSTKIGVELSVSADASIKSDIESYVKRELRLLGDIDLYATEPDFEIQLVAIKPGSAVAVSVVVLQKLNFTAYLERELKKTNIIPKSRDDIVKTVAEQTLVDQHFLYSDSINNLDQLCKSIVAKIDSGSFESERKLNGLIQKYVDPKPKPTPEPQPTGPVFEGRYVGGNNPPTITVKNIADRTMYLTFSGSQFVVASGGSQVINTTDGGIFNFKASAVGVIPLEGSREFKRGYIYSWTFFIKKSP